MNNPGFTAQTSLQQRGEDHAPLSVSVVICTRNRPKFLETCLRALESVRYPQFETIVVNNGSSEEDIKAIACRHGVKYIYVPVPGLSRARNAGAKASQAEVIAYIDDDAIPEPEWLDHLIAQFQDPMTIVVTGRVERTEAHTEAERISKAMDPPLSERSQRVIVDKNAEEWFEKCNFGGVGIGCNMAIRRSAWNEWPGFDERLGRGAAIDAGEEHFAFFSLVRRGYRVVYTPDAVVAHSSPQTMAELRAHHSKNLSAATGYVALLLAEVPEYRGATLRFVMARLKRSPRNWRERRPVPRIIPRWRALAAMLSGPLRYLGARIASGKPAKNA
jgi:O-antigen biosynthesis protein